MLTRLLVYCAYSLKTSTRYQNFKLFFNDLLENQQSKLKSYFDVFMIGMVILSVFLLIYEASNTQNQLAAWYEQVIVGLFIVEYLLRFWLCSDNHKLIVDYYETTRYLNVRFSYRHLLKELAAKKLNYVLNPLAIIDLLAILPSYPELRVLRVFIIFRLAKLFRYFNSIKLFADILYSKRFELYTLGVFVGFFIFIGGTALYLFENPANGGKVNNLFEAFYLSVVTLSTVGYGDITPLSVSGRLTAMVLIFFGLVFIAFFTSIIVAAFNEKMQDMRDHRIYAEIKRFKNFTIICGFGRVGQHVARQLQKNHQHFVIIDHDPSAVENARHFGYLAIHANASDNGVLHSVGINRAASAVLCTTGDDVVNVYITLTSRHLNSDIRIISRANNPENVNKLYQAGASNVIQPFEIAGMIVAEYIGQPVAFEAIFGIIRQEKELVMDTLSVLPHCMIDGKSIAQAEFEQRKLLLIGVISSNAMHVRSKNRYQLKNQHFYFNPEPHFILREGDLLVLLGKPVSIDYFRSQLAKSRLHNPFKLGQ